MSDDYKENCDLTFLLPGVRESVHFERVVAAHITNKNAEIGEDVYRLFSTIMHAGYGWYRAKHVKDRIEAYEQSQERHRAAGEHLRKAAVLSGFPPGYYIKIIKKHWATNGYGPEADRRADETVEQWTQRRNINLHPGDDVSEFLGKRGGSTNPDGATRGLVVRMIAQYVPSNTRHRFAAISYFSKLARVDVDNRLARSILLKGRT